MSHSSIHVAQGITRLLSGAAEPTQRTIPPASPEKVDALIAVLKSDAPHKEKVDACRGLAVIGTKDAIPVIASFLGDEKLSHMARYALEPMPDPAVDEVLRDALGKLKGRPLVGVIGSVGFRQDEKAVPSLVAMLQDADPHVARTAARSLGKIGSPDAVTPLTESLATSAPDLRPALAGTALACAEKLLAAGKPAEAAALYLSVQKADLPTHFRLAATGGALQAQQPDSSP